MLDWQIKKQEGNEEFKKGNYKASITLYTDAIYINPYQDSLYSNRGLAYMNIEENLKAKQDFIKAIEINPKNIKAMKRISYLYIREGSFTNAEVYLNQVKIIAPNDERNLEELKECLELIDIKKKLEEEKVIKNFKQISVLSSKILAKCPNFLEMKLVHFDSVINEGRLKEAEEFYEGSFSESEKKNEKIKYLLMLLYFYEGKYDKSKSILLSLIEETTDNSYMLKLNEFANKLEHIEILKNKANLFYIKMDYESAIKIYDELLVLENNNNIFKSVILSNRGLCFYKKKMYLKALEDLNKSVELNGYFAKSFQRRASVHIQMGNVFEAKSDLKKVLELEPINKEARILLCQINKEENKYKEKDLYKILEVSKSASISEIRKSFKKLVLKWHPDKNNESKEKQLYAEKVFKEINDAYNILGDEEKKEEYDKTHNKNKYRTNNIYNNDNYKHQRERSRDKQKENEEANAFKSGFHY